MAEKEEGKYKEMTGKRIQRRKRNKEIEERKAYRVLWGDEEDRVNRKKG